MPVVYRWWQKNRLQIIFGVSGVAIAWLVFQSKGMPILEIFNSFFRFSQTQTQAENARKTFLADIQFKELQNQLTEIEAENQQLKKLLGYVKTQKGTLVTAPVIGRSPSAWWQIVTIGVGTKQGIKKDDIVTGIGGLVGRIVETTPHTSRVLLISDATSSVGATMGRTRYMGFIKGNSTQTATMQFYAKVSDVKKGDVVFTSSVSTIFPPGIPIGKVKSVNLNKSPAPEATIEFTAPIDFLEWVVVHTK